MSDTTLSPILLAGEALTIEAALSGEKIPRFTVTPAYNGGPLRVARYNLPIIVDLAGLTVNSQAVLATVEHDDERTVGHVERIDNNGRQLSVAGVISAAGPAVAELLESHRRNFPWHASIEARPLETPEYIGPGEAVRVNGQLIAGPVLVARRSELFGISFVPRGADEHTAVAIAAQAVGDGAPITFEEWIDAIGVTADDLAANPDLEQRLRAKYDEATGNKSDDSDTSDSDSDEENMNASHLQAAVDATIQAADLSPTAAALLRAEAISGKMTFNDFERAVIKCAKAKQDLEALRASRPKGPTIMSGQRLDNDMKIYECALMRHIGQRGLAERIYAEQTLDAADRIHANHVLDIFRGALQFEGSKDDLIRASLGPSTSDIPTLLSNVANKTVLDQYQSFPSAARLVAAKLSANDFKSHVGIQLTADATFKLLPAGGEIKNASLGEQTFTYRIDTFARLVTIDRRDVINDDLGAFAQLPMVLGRGAAVAVESAFFTLLLSNPSSFFDVGNGNLIADVLASEGLGVGVQTLLKMVDANGDPVNAIPRFLLLPPELKKTGDELFRSTFVNTGGSSTATQVPNANTFFGMYEPVVSPYLSNANYSGYSETGWYLLCDPANIPAFALSYLSGQDSPTVEQVDLPPNQLGICLRGFLDFGCAAMDKRGAVKSTGAGA